MFNIDSNIQIQPQLSTIQTDSIVTQRLNIPVLTNLRFTSLSYFKDSEPLYQDPGSNGSDCVRRVFRLHGVTDEEYDDACSQLGISPNDQSTDKHFKTPQSGITVLQMVELAKQINISLYVVDLKYNELARIVRDDSKRRKQNRYHAIGCVAVNHHLYILQKDQFAKVIAKGYAVQFDKQTSLSKPIETELSKPTVIDEIDLNNLPEGILVTNKRFTDAAVDYMKDTNTVPEHSFVGSIMTKLVIGDKTLYFNKTPTDAIKLAEYRKEPFVNKSVARHARDLIKSFTELEFNHHVKSYYASNQIRQLYDQNPAGWLNQWYYPKPIDFEKIPKRNLKAIDISKCYRSIIENEELPFISMDDPLTKYSRKTILKGFYMLNLTYELCIYKNLPNLNGPIDYRLVKYLLKTQRITYKNITHFQPCRYTDEYKGYPGIIDKNIKSKSVSKIVVNSLAGCLGMNMECVQESSILTDNPEDSLYYKLANDTSLYKLSDKLYKTSSAFKSYSTSDSKPAFRAIVQLGWLKALQLVDKIQDHDPDTTIIMIKTDCVIYKHKRGATPFPVEANPKYGQYRKDKVPDELLTTDSVRRDHETGELDLYPQCVPKPRKLKWQSDTTLGEWSPNTLPEELAKPQSYLVQGAAGTGKSKLLSLVAKNLEKHNLTYQKLSYTGVASSLIGGQTLHRFFKIRVGTELPNPLVIKNCIENLDAIIIDEFSFLTQPMLAIISMIKRAKPSILIYLFGESDQLKGVSGVTLDNNPIFIELCENRLTLTHNYRGGFINDLREGKLGFNDLKSLPFNNANWHTNKLNFAFTNKKCQQVNDILQKLYGRDKIGSYVKATRNTVQFTNNSIFTIVKTYRYLPPKKGEKVTEKHEPTWTLQNIINKEEIIVDDKTFKTMFDLGAYCHTVHSVQGMTITQSYNIHEHHKFPSFSMWYVVCSRARNINQITLIDDNTEFTPIVYTIAKPCDKDPNKPDLTKPYYIGSTGHRYSSEQSHLTSGRFPSGYRLFELETETSAKSYFELREQEDLLIKQHNTPLLLNKTFNY